MLFSEETEFDYTGQSNSKGLEFEYFDSNCLPDESLAFDFSPSHSVPNLLSPCAFVHPLDLDSKTFELNETCDFTLNDFVNDEDGGVSSGEDISVPSTLLGSGFSNSEQQSPASWLMTDFIPEDFTSHNTPIDSMQGTRTKFSIQHPLMSLSVKNNSFQSRQPNGVISGRIKKRDYVPPVIHIKKSPTTSPTIHVNQTPMNHTAFTPHRTHSTLPIHPIPILQRPIRPTPYQPLSNIVLSQPNHNHSVMEILTNSPNDELDAKDFHATPSSIMKNYYSDAFSSTDEEDSHSPQNYAMLTANVEASLRNGTRENTNTILLHSMNGGGSLQSSTTPMITEEEMRVMASEGYSIPNLSFPLSKSDEKILKKVRRKIKNKLSAQESRKKKKEYLEKLEKQADSLNQENISLKRRLEDVERRLEMVEVRNRQLMCRLSKVTNSDCSVEQQHLSTSMTRPMNGHVVRPSTTISPTSRCGSTNSNPNSTKFYIMAFVLFFSVLFAGDPSFMTIRPGSHPGIFPFPTSLLISHGHSSRGMGRALLSYYPNLYRSRFFSDVFCPAGVNNCHHPLNKWDRLNRPNSRHKKCRNNASVTHGPIHAALDEKTQVKWMRRFQRAMNDDILLGVTTRGKMGYPSPLMPHLIKTPSILLDSTHDHGDNTISECSLSNFWKLWWKCEEKPKSNHLLSSSVPANHYVYNDYRNVSFSQKSTNSNVTNSLKSMTVPSSLLLYPIK